MFGVETSDTALSLPMSDASFNELAPAVYTKQLLALHAQSITAPQSWKSRGAARRHSPTSSTRSIVPSPLEPATD